MIYQLDLFHPAPSELDVLRKEMEEALESQNRMRRSLFAKQNDIFRMILEINQRLDKLEKK